VCPGPGAPAQGCAAELAAAAGRRGGLRTPARRLARVPRPQRAAACGVCHSQRWRHTARAGADVRAGRQRAAAWLHACAVHRDGEHGNA
jgi:hypothetical protein